MKHKHEGLGSLSIWQEADKRVESGPNSWSHISRCHTDRRTGRGNHNSGFPWGQMPHLSSCGNQTKWIFEFNLRKEEKMATNKGDHIRDYLCGCLVSRIWDWGCRGSLAVKAFTSICGLPFVVRLGGSVDSFALYQSMHIHIFITWVGLLVPFEWALSLEPRTGTDSSADSLLHLNAVATGNYNSQLIELHYQSA